jgi:hypothetical protein
MQHHTAYTSPGHWCDERCRCAVYAGAGPSHPLLPKRQRHPRLKHVVYIDYDPLLITFHSTFRDGLTWRRWLDMAVGCILLAASGPASACVGTIVTCMHGEQPGYTRRLPKTPLQLPRSQEARVATTGSAACQSRSLIRTGSPAATNNEYMSVAGN